jgi:sugar phosphate isomerase/epimerase
MTLTRRDFLISGSALTAGSIAGLPLLTNCSSQENQLKNIGLITGTIRNEIRADHVKALEEVAGIGYKYLEFGGYMGDSLPDFMALLKKLGLIPIAGGTSMAQMTDKDELKKMIDEALELEKKYLVCYWPWLTDALNLTMDELKTAADNLNAIGLTCKEEGIRFAFHNHDKEFWPVGETLPFDYLLENTSKDLVIAEMDLYWLRKGNADPVTYFEKYPGRFELIHAKDMDDTEERSFACVGDGIIDFPAIFEKAKLAGMKYIIVEHDKPEFPMQCIRDSYNYLQSIL